MHRYAFDITEAVKGWKTGNYDRNKGIIFSSGYVENKTTTTCKTFASYNRSQYQPSLTVTYEVGISIDSAETIRENKNTTVELSASMPSKFFKFVPERTRFFTVECWSSTGDPFVRLYNTDGQVLGSDNNSRGGNNFLLVYHLVQGQTYYIETSSYNNQFGTYVFSVHAGTLSSHVQASIMQYGADSTVRSTYAGEQRFYKFTPESGGEYLFYSSNAAGNPSGWIYTSSLSLLNADDNGAGNNNFRVTATLTAGQTYYFAAGHSGAYKGTYTLHILKSAELSAGVYLLKNVGSSRYMDIDGPGKQQQVHQWDRHDGLQERWRIEKQSDGYYTIRSQYGKTKYVGAENTSIGVDNINLYDGISDKTRWKIYTNSIGELFLEPKTAIGKVIYAPNNNNNTELQLDYLGNNNTRSKWKEEQLKAIILLPGIMGSQIFAGQDITISIDLIDNTFHKGDRLWDPDPNSPLLIDEKIFALEMDENRISKYATYIHPPTINSRDKSDNGFQFGAQDIYRGIYNRLYDEFYKANECDVVFFEYDWREHPYDTAKKLDKFINDQGYGSVTFVSHSMGGIVSSFYLSLGYSQRDKVNKHISIGTPYLGSAEMADVYLTGDAVDLDFFEEIFSRFTMNPAVARTVHSFPSIYALFPYEQHWEPYVRYCETYDSTTDFWKENALRWNESLMHMAKTYNKILFTANDAHITQTVNSYYFVGKDQRTIKTVTVGERGIIGRTYTTDGDGTVTLQSALIGYTIDSDKVRYCESSHVGMIDDETCLSEIASIIRGG